MKNYRITAMLCDSMKYVFETDVFSFCTIEILILHRVTSYKIRLYICIYIYTLHIYPKAALILNIDDRGKRRTTR